MQGAQQVPHGDAHMADEGAPPAITNCSAAEGGTAGGSERGDGAAVKYLSSYKLFGLQLRDASFRRSFLVQVRL